MPNFLPKVLSSFRFLHLLSITYNESFYMFDINSINVEYLLIKLHNFINALTIHSPLKICLLNLFISLLELNYD